MSAGGGRSDVSRGRGGQMSAGEGRSDVGRGREVRCRPGEGRSDVGRGRGGQMGLYSEYTETRRVQITHHKMRP